MAVNTHRVVKKEGFHCAPELDGYLSTKLINYKRLAILYLALLDSNTPYQFVWLQPVTTIL